jgi:hypothetical protein
MDMRREVFAVKTSIKSSLPSATAMSQHIAGGKGQISISAAIERLLSTTCSNLATAPRKAATSDQQFRVVVGFALSGDVRPRSAHNTEADSLVTRSDGLAGLLDLRVVHQARACTVAVDLLADLLEVAEQDGGVLDVAVLVRVASHAALTVEVLALKRSFDLLAQDIVAFV